MIKKQTIHFDIEYYGFSSMKDLFIEVEFTPDEIALMRNLVSQLDKSLYNEGILFVLQDSAPALYNRIEVAARSEIYDRLVIKAIQNNEIEISDRDLQYNYECDVKSGRFIFELDDFAKFGERLDPEELKAREYDTWYEKEMNKDPEDLRSRYNIDAQVEVPQNLVYICNIPVNLLT